MSKTVKSKAVKLSKEVLAILDKLRHAGQSYDGVLREVLQKHDSNDKDKN